MRPGAEYDGVSAVTVRSAASKARVVVGSVVMTIGVTADGGGVLGLDVGDSEDGAFCTALVVACAL